MNPIATATGRASRIEPVSQRAAERPPLRSPRHRVQHRRPQAFLAFTSVSRAIFAVAVLDPLALTAVNLNATDWCAPALRADSATFGSLTERVSSLFALMAACTGAIGNVF